MPLANTMPNNSAFTDADPLATWDATETVARIRSKDVTVAQVVESAIARSEKNRSLGAVVETTYERARAQINANYTGIFSGVPTFVKDLAQVKGVPTTWGSRGSVGYVSKRSDPIVKCLEQLGFIMLGKSACPELGLTATTEPLGREPCRNPRDPSRTAGGSSGGAAALVAAGVVSIAHGSDGGGSIRIPAACCGLVGFKASRFRIDMDGSNLLPVNVAVDGVLTRSVRDTILFHRALERQRKPRGIAPIGEVGDRPAKNLRMAVFTNAPNGTPVDAEVRDATLAAAKKCETLGHHVEEIPYPFEGRMNHDFMTYWGFVAWIQLLTSRFLIHSKFDNTKVDPWTSGLDRSFAHDKRAGFAAIQRLRGFGRTFAKFMERYDVLVSPTVAEPAPLIGHLTSDQPYETKYDRLSAFAPFTALYNVAGAPAISLPLGRTEKGLPLGVQLAAVHGADRTLLELASSLEAG